MTKNEQRTVDKPTAADPVWNFHQRNTQLQFRIIFGSINNYNMNTLVIRAGWGLQKYNTRTWILFFQKTKTQNNIIFHSRSCLIERIKRFCSPPTPAANNRLFNLPCGSGQIVDLSERFVWKPFGGEKVGGSRKWKLYIPNSERKRPKSSVHLQNQGIILCRFISVSLKSHGVI